jgi:hypothetical protein
MPAMTRRTLIVRRSTVTRPDRPELIYRTIANAEVKHVPSAQLSVERVIADGAHLLNSRSVLFSYELLFK